ncbi:MAG: aldehyde dehydrogenase family protein, partial [Mesorhizobium sp.]
MSAHFARPHRHEALDRLTDRRLLRDLGYVGGHWTAGHSAASFEVTDPATGATVAFVAALDAGQTIEAIDAASRALPAWRSGLPQERSRILRKWFELMIAAKDDLALLMTLEQGKPL